ncbi:hypothetical protein, partial [Chitinophaga sp.]|uniref:hypothetical protein n=1 Tax=Chitinophaga sp. TaxID=1869181 RepID=UPI002F91C6B7
MKVALHCVRYFFFVTWNLNGLNAACSRAANFFSSINPGYNNYIIIVVFSNSRYGNLYEKGLF